MGEKIFFFDIDLTLCTRDFKVPQSTIETIKQLKKNGHTVCLSSGRAKYAMEKYIKLFDVDHYVCAEGNSAYFNHQCIHSDPLDSALIEKLLAFTEKEGYALAMISDKDNGVTQINETVVSYTGEMNLGRYTLNPNYYQEETIYKAFIYADKAASEKIVSLFSEDPYYIFSSGVAFAKRHKERGIKSLISKLNIKKEDVVVFGDGENDLTMFEFADTKIAMGNAVTALKDKATYVTKDVEADGIYHACKHFDWIET